MRQAPAVLRWVAAALLASGACTRGAPAGFWTDYRSPWIVAQSSDQGPWGGVRWIHWEASAAGALTEA
jgi:hypothetical protein